MSKSLIFLALVAAASAAHGAELTPTEQRWLAAGEPVLAYARQLKLPIDIIVQPQARANDVPLAMGFAGGRCKLVFSMRGNPNAEAIVAQLPEAERATVMEAITAHEVAHCWRYAQGVWHTLPAGFEETGEESAASDDLLQQSKAMRENRREEGFADLVALAWTERFHRDRYASVYSWLAKVRADQPVARNGHVYSLRLGGDGVTYQAWLKDPNSVDPTWRAGLLNDD